AIFDGSVVAEYPQGLEDVRIDLAPAQAQAGDRMQRQQLAAMRKGLSAAESATLQLVQHPGVLGDAVAQTGIHLENIQLRPCAAKEHAVFYVLMREQVFSSS